MIRRLCDRISEGESRESLMNFEWSRFESFKTFPGNVPVSALRMTAAGFYYVGQSDKVKCFSCAVVHSGWREGDSPSEIHARLSPSCEFIRGTDGNNVPIQDHTNLLSVPTNTETSQNGISAGETNGASGGRTQATGFPITNGTTEHNLRDCPKFSVYTTYRIRMNSFIDPWMKEDVISSEVLAEAGFFYTGFSDCVRCFQCGICLRNWETGDDPWIEHAKYYPWCNSLLKQKGSDFVNANAPDICSSTEVGGAGSNKQTSERSSRGEEIDNPERFQYQKNDPAAGQPDVTGNVKSPDSVKDEESQGLDAKAQALQKELEELKDKLMCKICCSCEANVVFLPCSHMVSCQTCAPHIPKCAICRQPIEGRKKIFLP